MYSPAAAREIVARLCAAGEVDEATAETVMLLTSEVVTNAVTHGTGIPVLSVAIRAGVLRVTVTDENGQQPRVVSPPGGSVAGGRGIYLIDTLASRWGSDPHPGSVGKTVWFELDRPTPA